MLSKFIGFILSLFFIAAVCYYLAPATTLTALRNLQGMVVSSAGQGDRIAEAIQ